ncbi:MAG: sulfurtransferase [Nitrospirales bacterium]|nr:MAG: sulfurtransferase [Nitrospirales bacterium]
MKNPGRIYQEAYQGNISPNRNATPVTNQLIIDVRTPGEFEEVHIPGSMNIPLTDLESSLPELRERVKNYEELILVCRTQNRVELAHNQLVAHGIRHARILEGGVTQWVADGKPVIRGKQGMSLERQVRLAAGMMIVVGIISGVLISPWFLLLPAAAGIGLMHAGWTDSCLMGMLLTFLPYNRRSPSAMERPVLGEN